MHQLLSTQVRNEFFMTSRLCCLFKCLSQIVAALVLFVAVMGCRQDEPIVKQRVPKSRSGLETLHTTQQADATVVSAPSAAVSDRMVVAIYQLDEATWFFKLNGTNEQVQQTESQWKPFFEAAKFDNGSPQWDLPEGWRTGNDRPMRFATIVIGDFEPPLEMAISSLGPGQDLLLNVNRWRGQMGLPPIAKSQLNENTQPMKSNAKSALLFDVVGKQSSTMTPPFANLTGRPNGPVADNTLDSNTTSTATAPDATVKFDTPDGWALGKTSQMVPVRLEKAVGEKTIQITIVRLPAAANEWQPNTQRWAGEVGMLKLSDDDIKSLTSDIIIDGIPGQLLKLIPTEEVNSRASIAGMVKQDETAWFLKLTGDKSLVIEHETVFVEFLKSLKLP